MSRIKKLRGLIKQADAEENAGVYFQYLWAERAKKARLRKQKKQSRKKNRKN